jgi:hypothetical protein
MNRSIPVLAGLVLVVAGLGACGQDSVEDANAEVCSAISELQGEIATFRTMLTDGSTRDQLLIQAQSISAETKNVVLDSKNLAQSVAQELQSTGDQLRSDLGELDTEGLSEESVRTSLSGAMNTYEAGVQQVTAELGCADQ